MTDSFKEFVTRWTTPSVLISLLLMIVGGITWGVQINSAILKLTESQSKTQTVVAQMRSESLDAALIQAKTAALVESIAKQVDQLERRMTRNESWINENRSHTHRGREGE